jgi:hypothetical protein
MGHTAWHMGRRWTYGRALRGKVARHLLGSVCGHMHVRVGLGWGTRHGVWVSTGQVSRTDEDVGFFEGGLNVTPGPILMPHEWHVSADARVYCHIAS